MPTGKRSCSGFTYLGLLMVIAITGIGLAGVGIVYSQDMQREREKELMFVGDEYKKAIGSYYESSPGSNKQFPTSLDELILDKRYPTIKRHIRKLYTDPMLVSMTSKQALALILQQGKIIGVHTLSEQDPIKKTGFGAGYDTFVGAQKYSDWKFIYTPGSVAIKVAGQ